MSSPSVTVLMAVYNNGPFLQEAIASVLAQTLPDLELLVVDDGSTDGGWETITAAAASDRRVVARRRPVNGGASRALNEAITLARGRFITRQDADDVSLPTRLLEQVAFLEASPDVAGVGTQAALIDEAGTRLTETSFPLDGDEIARVLPESMCFVGPTVMARRSTWQAAGLWFDDELSGSEDYDLCLRLSEHGRLANIPSPLYLYRQHAGSVSHRRRHQQLARKAQALENAIRRRHRGEPPAAGLVAVARDYLRAGVVARLAGDRDAARAWLERAVSRHPGIHADEPLVEAVVRRYLGMVAEDERQRTLDDLFANVLPPTRGMRRVGRRLRGEMGRSPAPGAAGALWTAVRRNPGQLLDRQAMTRLVRRALGRQ